MARFSLVFAPAGVLLLVAMAAIAEASTIVTTTTLDENRRGTSGSESGCYQQIAEQDMLSHCGMYLMKSLGGRSRGSGRIAGREEDHMQLCCMQLQNLSEECMCPGIRMMLNQPMWRMMGQMMDQMMSVAQSLPTQCNLRSQPCQMRVEWV